MIALEIQSTDNGINVVLVSVIGVRSSKYLYTQFGSDDYWRWGYNQGKCDGTYVGTDAADQLRIRFNSPLNKTYIEGYYTSVVCINEYCNTHPLPNYQYRMFFDSGSGSTPPMVCLSPDQLNFYLSNFDFIKDKNCPIGKQFKCANVIEDFALLDDSWMIAHFYKLYYGTFVSGASPQ